MNIGEKIKSLRLEKKLTQEELASAAGTTKQTIHKYEIGIISNIPASKIKAIADKLETTPAYLMGWEKETQNNKLITECTITQKELEHLTIYRRLNSKGQQKADEYIQDLSEQAKYTNNSLSDNTINELKQIVPLQTQK